ncbi:MAG TPA: MMPL family transporter [Spirochaetia bacterium]|nr:MMPL family transporter [Spirochaetales bacterium]HRY80660.1 MMPL family transporter [Spirochaetia bacterium]
MKFESGLSRLGAWTVRHPLGILAATAVLTAAAIWAAAGLGVETDISQMLPPENPAARGFSEVSEAFATTSSLVVVVEGPDRAALIGAAEAFTARIREDPRTSDLVGSARLKADRAFLETWGLLLQDAEELEDTDRLMESTRLVPLLRAANDLMEEKLSDGSDEEVEGPEGEDEAFALMSRLGLFAEILDRRVAAEAVGTAPDELATDAGLADAWLFGEEYFLDPEERTLLLTLRPTFDLGDRKRLTSLTENAEALAREVESGLPGIRFSFTGDVANEADEERAIGSDLFYPSLLALSLILILFLASFRRRRSILFATAALGVGIVADLGFAALTVGKLNMITTSFGALLVGLGIDFGIHLASRYDSLSDEIADPAERMGRVFASVGNPVLVGGLTTALAFYSLLLSRTLAFRQFGLIAGTGILTTLAASFFVLPALVAAFPGRPGSGRARPVLSFSLPVRAARACGRRPGLVLACGAALAVLAGSNIPRNAFDFDMRRIGPQGTAAQEAERLVAERFGISTWQHMALAESLEEARALQERFRDAPLVRGTESAADWIPGAAEQEERLARIALIAARPSRDSGPGWDDKGVEDLLHEVRRLEWNVLELGDLAAMSLGEESLPVRKRNALVREITDGRAGTPGREVFGVLRERVEALPRARAAEILSGIDRGFSAALDRKVRFLAAADRALTVEDLPEDLRSEYVSPDGSRYLVLIRGASGLAESAAIERFAAGLSAVDPEATGSLALGVELSREILAEARSSALIVGILVFAVVAAGFRSLSLSVLAGAAFAAALAWTFGLQPLFGRFNIVNALSLPLILGVGIDYCVHVLSALRTGNPEDLVHSIKAVTLSMLTTALGFGSLALAGRFAGIAALGETLTLGILSCYAAALTLVPALAGIPFHRASARRIPAGRPGMVPERKVSK